MYVGVWKRVEVYVCAHVRIHVREYMCARVWLISARPEGTATKSIIEVMNETLGTAIAV